jgi:hypothetical protein
MLGTVALDADVANLVGRGVVVGGLAALALACMAAADTTPPGTV